MSQRIHASAAVGFDRGGAAYERGRPGYPEEAVAKLGHELGLEPERAVLDLAAGTGKLTRALVGLGVEVIAVEPVAGMREQLLRSVPTARVLNGTAEQIPMADQTVQGVTVAQAFHWFNAPLAAAEIHRVLVPGGGLGVMWNRWDETLDWVRQTQALVHEHVHGAPQQDTSRWEGELESTGLFTRLQRTTMPNIVHGDLDVLLARILSVSYIAALEQKDRDALLAAVTEVIATHPDTAGQAELEMPYATHILWGRRA